LISTTIHDWSSDVRFFSASLFAVYLRSRTAVCCRLFALRHTPARGACSASEKRLVDCRDIGLMLVTLALALRLRRATRGAASYDA
jgi:hypothetical protein